TRRPGGRRTRRCDAAWPSSSARRRPDPSAAVRATDVRPVSPAGGTPPPPDLAEIPAGWFGMGWLDGLPDARPPRRVWVDAFAIARRPVTRREYAAFLAARGTAPPPAWADPRFADPDQPAIAVSWLDAVAYCAWLSAAT